MKVSLLLTLLIFTTVRCAFAQGCSDAGFCSIGSLAHDTKKAKSGQLKISLPVGSGDENVFVFTPAIEYTHAIGNWQLQGKLTGNYASGNLGSAVGAGDVFLSGTYQLPTEKKWKTAFTLGGKFPLNQSNLKEGTLSLPMQYQSSLGTIDLIAGVSFSSDRWKWAAGWQQPLTGANRNNFLPVYWNDETAMKYPSTNDFNRKADVLLRSSYRVLEKKSLSLEAGLLGIYHVAEDTYVNANVSNRPISIEGSHGLTLNATAAFEFKAGDRITFGIIGGVPLVVRDVRPDGLTRSFVLIPNISFQL
jgi:hypothetical protein